MTRYRAPDPLLIVQLDALAAVFHRPTGTTQLVEPLVPELLDALCPNGTGPEALPERVAARLWTPGVAPGVTRGRRQRWARGGVLCGRVGWGIMVMKWRGRTLPGSRTGRKQ